MIIRCFAVLALLISTPTMAQEQPSGPDPMFQMAFFVGIFVLFYFIAIRPQRKRQKETQDMLGGLTVGDEVATTSGMLGKVRKLEDGYLVLKVAENVELKFQKSAVHAVLPKGTIKQVG